MKRRDYVDFRLSKTEWNARTRKLLEIYNKRFQVFEHTNNSLRVRIYDVCPFYPLNPCGADGFVAVDNANEMVLIATMTETNKLEVGDFAIERVSEERKYESGRVVFVKDSTMLDEYFLDRYRPIYPIFRSIRQFYKENENLVKAVYNDLVSGELKVSIKQRGLNEMEPIKVFLSVPISGLDIETVKSNVNSVKSAIRRCFSHPYLEVLTPFEICGGELDKPYSWFMGRDIEALLECDAMVSLPGWESSKGCRCERATAEIYGLRIYDAADILAMFDSDILYQLLANGDIRKFKILDRGLVGEMVSRVKDGKDIDVVEMDGSVKPLWDGYDNQFKLDDIYIFSKDYKHCQFFASEEAAVKARDKYMRESIVESVNRHHNVYSVSLADPTDIKCVATGLSDQELGEMHWRTRVNTFNNGFFYFSHPTGVEQPETKD